MIPGADPEDDRCLFSGVLLEGLWGTRREAFSRLVEERITSRSLAAYLVAEVNRLSARYGEPIVPSVSPSFPEGDDIYFGAGPRPRAPVFPDWPLALHHAAAGGGGHRDLDLDLPALARRLARERRSDDDDSEPLEEVSLEAPDVLYDVEPLEESLEAADVLYDLELLGRIRAQSRPEWFDTRHGH
jgi:hypothetical protein